ncbi:MAG: ribonuclease H-like domain-containing protein [Dehalococcoidales bacterium]|nr:ribonuclease H-like domain-containing protein [Dehalococcoidales bacterium]
MSPAEAYLDIETTGLSPADCDITVTGIYRWGADGSDCVQLIGRDNTADNILEALDGIPIIYTYNGKRFDLPFIHSRVGINLETLFPHHDLMFDCWRNRLMGGLKSVERQMGITRKLPDVNGFEAIRLWWRYVETFDLDALNTLLEYNKEDVVNLKTLKDMLCPE